MAYIYAANIWCDDCGESIKKRAIAEGKDTYSYDSDEFPKRYNGSLKAGCPQHCAADADCINAIEFDDGTKIGAWLGNDLTTEGVDYVKETIREAREDCGCPDVAALRKAQEDCGCPDVAALWAKHYDYLDFSVTPVCDGCSKDFDFDDLDENNLCVDCRKGDLCPVKRVL